MDEGAGSTITQLPEGWVLKTQKRAVRGKRVSVERQLELQTWAAKHLTLANGYSKLFCPEAQSSSEPNSYQMRAVSTRGIDPWFLVTVPAEYQEEVTKFRAEFQAATGSKLHDVELYLQPDGRVAVLDFDQCHTVVCQS